MERLHQLRMWNEVATVLLFAIVFLIVLKSLVDTLLPGE
jgi:protoporphyrinogen IX oxidase